jgi:hypothetical protein
VESSVRVRVPVDVPGAVGVKVTEMVQLAPAPSDAPQVLVSANGPVIVIVEIARTNPPELVTVTVWAALLVFRS